MSSLNIKSIDPHYRLPPAYCNRIHLLCTLPNGLQCLLIHDNSSEMISGVMAVGCGSFKDPPNAIGIAHLTEHMILRGSKQYKPPFSLAHLLYSAGGLLNAYTTGDQTCFYFEVSSYAEDNINGSDFMLESLLPVFSSLLTCPIMSEQFVRLEIKSVDDEHNENCNNEDKIFFHSLRLLANSNHVFSHFATGNHHTLSEISTHKLRRLTGSYFKENFRPSNMSFVLKGPQTILQLKKLAIVNFLNMGESPSLSKKPIRCPLISSETSSLAETSNQVVPLFDETGPNKIVIKGAFLPKIRVCFPVYHMNHKNNYKVTVKTLCNLLGEESPLSLSNILRERNWISSLYVFVQVLFSDVHLLIVEMTPTGSAWSQIDEISEEIISYAVSNLGDSDEDELRSLISHFAAIDQFNFENQLATESSLDEVLDYAERLNRPGSNPMKDNFISEYETWDNMSTAHQEIQDMVRYCFSRSLVKIQILVPDNMSIEQLVNKRPMTDPYFNFQYALVHSRWSEKTARQSNKGLPSPKLNLAEQIMRKSCPYSTHIPFKIRDMHYEREKPTLKAYDMSHEIWTVASDEVESIATVFLRFPYMKPTVTNSVILDLLVELVFNEVRNSLYECEKIGCFWGLLSNINRAPSIMMSASGTKFAVEHAITEVFKELRQLTRTLGKIPYAKLRQARVAVRRRYEEQAKSHNIKKVLSSSYLILESGLNTPMDKIEELELVGTEVLLDFEAQLSKTKEYRVFLISEAIDEQHLLVNACMAKQCSTWYHKPEYPVPSSVVLRDGCFYEYKTIVSEDDNLSIVMHYTQIGLRTDLESYAFALLYLHVLSSNTIEEMRIKRQLAYTVYSGIRMFQKTFGVYLLVPSGRHSCNYLVDQVEEFLKVVEDIVSCFSEEEFQSKFIKPFVESINNNNKMSDEAGSSLFSALQPQRGSGRRPTSPAFNDHWNFLNQILNSTFNFNSKNCEEYLDENILRKFTKQALLSFIRTHMSVTSSTRSVVAICSHPAEGQRRKEIAYYLLQKLEKIGLDMKEEKLYEVLLQCQDQKSFSDVTKLLPGCFTQNNQKIKFKKLQLESMVGGTLKSLPGYLSNFSFKRNKSQPVKLAVERVKSSDYRQIHRENLNTHSVSLSEHFNLLMDIERRNDH